jgi:hypothetical protein
MLLEEHDLDEHDTVARDGCLELAGELAEVLVTPEVVNRRMAGEGKPGSLGNHRGVVPAAVNEADSLGAAFRAERKLVASGHIVYA